MRREVMMRKVCFTAVSVFSLSLLTSNIDVGVCLK